MNILRARIVLPVSAPAVENGAVCVDGGRIVAVGRAEDFTGGAVEDLGDVILMPGLINAHCHLDYTVMRGAILQQSSFPNWIVRINDLKRVLGDDEYLQSIADGFAELQRWGATSVFNIESFPELMVRMTPPPIRTWWFYELMDIRSRVHTEDVVAGALTFFERRPHWLGGFGLSPHAPYTTSVNLYQLTKFCAEKYSMPWMTHLAETDEEFEMFVRASGPLHAFLKKLGRRMDDTGGVTPLGRLAANDALPDGGILTHMNCLADSDYEILAKVPRKYTIAHCPNCHDYFARPPFELERLRALGVPVCLGTDSLASNTALNMFSEMRTFRRHHPQLSAAEVLDAATRVPAAAIGLPGRLGEMSPEAHADLIALPYSGVLEGALEAVLENRAPVEWMMIDGRTVTPKAA